MPCIEAIVTEPEPNDDKYKLNSTPDPDSSNWCVHPRRYPRCYQELERMLHPPLMEDIKKCESELDLIRGHHCGSGDVDEE
jgi:hypothetical protein